MAKLNGYRAKLSDSIVDRLKAYAKEKFYKVYGEYYLDTIGHQGQGMTVEDVIDELLKEAGF